MIINLFGLKFFIDSEIYKIVAKNTDNTIISFRPYTSMTTYNFTYTILNTNSDGSDNNTFDTLTLTNNYTTLTLKYLPSTNDLHLVFKGDQYCIYDINYNISLNTFLECENKVNNIDFFKHDSLYNMELSLFLNSARIHP